MPIVPGQQFTLHSHLLEEPCNVSRLLRTLDKDGHTLQVRAGGKWGEGEHAAGEGMGRRGGRHPAAPCRRFTASPRPCVSQVKPRSLAAGMTAVVRIRLLRRVPIERFVDHRRMGRFVLRYGDRTVAAGIVVKI